MAKAKMKKTPAESAVMVLLVLLINLLAAVAVLIIRSVFGGSNAPLNKASEQEKVKRNVVVCDESAIPEYDEQTVNTAANHDVKMNSTWTFADGKSYSKDAYVENPLSNKNAVFFDVKISGSDESVYTSPILPVGSHIENIAFDKWLSAGSYNGVVVYTLLGADGETSVGRLQVAVRIIVQR